MSRQIGGKRGVRLARVVRGRWRRPPLGCSKGMPDSHLSQAPPPVADHLPYDTCRTYPDLAAVVEAWAELPEAIRAGILAMVKATSGKDGWSVA